MASESPSLYQIEARIRAALDAPLPGAAAHLNLAPRPRRGWHPGHVPPEAKAAAGLSLLYPLYDAPHLVLIVRAGALPQHAGQVALPGGRVERSETVAQAALREAAEEVGIDPRDVRVLGLLSTLYIPVSDFALHPVIALTHERPTLRAETGEVGRILEVPVSQLRDSAGPRRGVVWRHGELFQVPYFELCNERVWGATAMVLAELLAALGVPLVSPWDE